MCEAGGKKVVGGGKAQVMVGGKSASSPTHDGKGVACFGMSGFGDPHSLLLPHVQNARAHATATLFHSLSRPPGSSPNASVRPAGGSMGCVSLPCSCPVLLHLKQSLCPALLSVRVEFSSELVGGRNE